jgi:protein-disulfide isomerase
VLRRVTPVVALLALGVASCHDGAAPRAPVTAEVDRYGVDTHDFTPREKREFSTYVQELPAPCNGMTMHIAECLTGGKPCSACLSAAQAIGKAVREGMAREQVEQLYKERFDVGTAKTIPLDGSPSRGPEGAPVVVVEFADFECPFCQKLAPDLDDLWEKRKDKVRFVYKFMPLQMHAHSQIAARAAIAALAQGKFWEMHHLLFANGQHLEQQDLEKYAKEIGLDVDRFRADMASAATAARIDTDRRLADDLGVKGTPTIYIDGREYDSKVDLAEWVDQEIATREKNSREHQLSNDRAN